jgi:hypothetical protein
MPCSRVAPFSSTSAAHGSDIASQNRLIIFASSSRLARGKSMLANPPASIPRY